MRNLAALVVTAVILSTLGTPWLALADWHRISLRSRLILFAWMHPGWAGMLRWAAALALFGAVWALVVERAVSTAG